MNLPNKLTVSRFALTGVFLAMIFWRSPYNDTAALIVFCLAGITDFLDGKIARDRNLITNFGKLMDPLADKILTCSAFIALVERCQQAGWSGVKVEAWMVVIIVGRELTITGLRLLAASKNVVLGAEGFGKHKTISQITSIIALLVLEAYGEWGHWAEVGLKPWVPTFARVALYLTVILTFSSGVLYLWRNRRVYLDEV
ncbi:MAG: CDP-diacylglycerol--glycerol-3-phosphate 3-phosphatidyltransferase [Pedosphaera sp.]|nr:CDP-diacylglycerol--glycerol-3-phosphate 3-phosphatidyltransferase [Pedosphaera sp.]